MKRHTHGLSLIDTATCPKCGEEARSRLSGILISLAIAIFLSGMGLAVLFHIVKGDVGGGILFLAIGTSMVILAIWQCYSTPKEVKCPSCGSTFQPAVPHDSSSKARNTNEYIKRVLGVALMSGGLLFLILGLLPTWINDVKSDLKLLSENPSTPIAALLPVLIDWALSIGITGIVAIGVILAGLGLIVGPSKKTEKELDSTGEARDNRGSDH